MSSFAFMTFISMFFDFEPFISFSFEVFPSFWIASGFSSFFILIFPFDPGDIFLIEMEEASIFPAYLAWVAFLILVLIFLELIFISSFFHDAGVE